jgi:muramoyltetrapeptide carboxypeptidase
MLFPELLKKGEEVMIISPASPPTSENWKNGIRELEKWGLIVKYAPHFLDSHFGLAGTDQQRLADFQLAINQPSIKAILPLRGGYGCSRILDQIDFSPLFTYPKWIIGFSDITAILVHLDSIGISAIHGPMPHNYMQEGGDEALEKLHQLLFEGHFSIELKVHPLNKLGEISAPLIGGNLSLLVHLLGSSSFPNPAGKILVIEEIGEKLYHVDRMLVQLKRAGVFKQLAGLLVGGFTDCKEANLRMGRSVEELILEHTAECNFPIVFDFPIGHIPNNYPLPFGKKINLLVKKDKVQLSD